MERGILRSIEAKLTRWCLMHINLSKYMLSIKPSNFDDTNYANQTKKNSLCFLKCNEEFIIKKYYPL